MRDEQRASVWMEVWGDLLPAGDRAGFGRALAEQLAAVRADERRAVVAWLDEQATFYDGPVRMGSEALADAADAIEAGAHAPEADR